MPDNYYTSYFELEIANYFKNEAINVWGNSVDTYAHIYNPELYGYGIPIGLNDRQSLQDMEALIEEYHLFVKGDSILGEEGLFDEAERILRFIQIVQESDYQLISMIFSYNNAKVQRINEHTQIYEKKFIYAIFEIAYRIQ